jgi:hypothetical protein
MMLKQMMLKQMMLKRIWLQRANFGGTVAVFFGGSRWGW